MGTRWLVILGILAVTGVSGCIVTDIIGDPAALAASNPTISQFLKEHPNADIKIVHYSYASNSMEPVVRQLNDQCGITSIPGNEYYVVNITDVESNLYITVWICWEDKTIQCALKRSISGADVGGINTANTTIIVKRIAETEGGSAATGGGGESGGSSGMIDQAARLAAAESKLQEFLCGSLPETGSRMPLDMLDIRINAPEDIEQRAKMLLDDTVTFNTPPYLVQNYLGERYFSCLVSSHIYNDNKDCIIPITIQLSDAGGSIATETGALYLTFTGNIGAYVPQAGSQSGDQNTQSGDQNTDSGIQEGPSDATWDTGAIIAKYEADHPVEPNEHWGSAPMPMLTRTGCELQIDRPCPVSSGEIFCGQCSYSETNSDSVRYRGTCWICPAGTSCSGGNDATHCATIYCVGGSSGGSSGGGVTSNYFTSCSNCQYGQRTINYNGHSYATCNYYYNLCVENDCADIRTNCR